MESLRDDELLSVFEKIHDESDKISFSQVSKQFLKVACIRLRRLETLCPRLLKDILHASPCLVEFQCHQSLHNTHMELVARSCPNLRRLMLSCYQRFHSDFDDDGLCAVANACTRLHTVELNGRLHAGDVGVGCLVRSCKDLIALRLSRCARVTDKSLKSIGRSYHLEELYLSSCGITDMGLKYLTKGDHLKKNLKTLNLCECRRITNDGVSYLKQMVNLTSLSLSMCWSINDHGILALSSQIPNIKNLDLSRLYLSDLILSHISSNCKKLMHIILIGCQNITGKGVRHFAHHPTLKYLTLFSCDTIYWSDVESVILACPSLHKVRLSSEIKTPMPNPGTNEKIHGCWIEWGC